MSELSDKLYQYMMELGYPVDLCRTVASVYMTTDFTATRMLGYLYRMSTPPRAEDLVDEMLAILSDRDAIIRKKEAEHAQMAINRLYEEGLGGEE